MTRTLIIVFCLLAFPSLAWASESPDKLTVILDQHRALQSDLAASKVDLTPRELGVVRKAPAEVFSLTAGKTSIDQLDIEEKVRLDLALERIDTQLKGGDLDHVAEGEEEVCKQVWRRGNTVKSTVCATRAEWDRIRQTSRDTLERRHARAGARKSALFLRRCMNMGDQPELT